MRLVYLPDARKDVAWWRLYYRRVFPQGGQAAYRVLAATERILQDNPLLGVELAELGGLRKLSIPNTPFAFIHRLRQETIEVLRLYDMRQQGSSGLQED